MKQNIQFFSGILTIALAVGVFYFPDFAQKLVTEKQIELLNPYHPTAAEIPKKELEGRYIFISGPITHYGMLEDPDFKFGALNLLSLNRMTEQFRWNYDEETETFFKAWSLEQKPLPDEARISEYKNPPITEASFSYFAQTATILNYPIAPELFAYFPKRYYSQTTISDDMSLLPNYQKFPHFLWKPVHSSSQMDQPNIGDQKVSWTYLKEGNYSLIALLKDGKLSPLPKDFGQEILVLEGIHPIETVLEAYNKDLKFERICLIFSFLLLALSGYFLYRGTRKKP